LRPHQQDRRPTRFDAARERDANVTHQQILKLSPSDMDSLITTLDVSFVELSECAIAPGWRVSLAPADAPGLHYNLGGAGRIVAGDQPPIDLPPHALVIVPPGLPVRIETPTDHRAPMREAMLDRRSPMAARGQARRHVVGEGAPQVRLMCGWFRAAYGRSIDLFDALPGAIIERFDADDRLDHKLVSALAELDARQVGMEAMTTALLKQVLITLLRRSLGSADIWAERFAMLSDPQIARVFADMVARPGSPHSVQSLARTAGLSRSAFMARFRERLGRSPMIALRDLRMHQAARLLAASRHSVDQVAYGVGYASRSSFMRAYRKTYGGEPAAVAAPEPREPPFAAEPRSFAPLN
jgi:AraC family transcriptional activator of mtrCDE